MTTFAAKQTVTTYLSDLVAWTSATSRIPDTVQKDKSISGQHDQRWHGVTYVKGIGTHASQHHHVYNLNAGKYTTFPVSTVGVDDEENEQAASVRSTSKVVRRRRHCCSTAVC